MRGKTLGECLTGLRTELRLSLNPAHNVQVRDTHVAVLQRTQEWLWENYTWPHMRVERYLQPQTGQRFYDPAGCKKISQSTGLLVAAGDVTIDRLDSVMWLRDGDVWMKVVPGINPADFNAYDSDAGDTAWPICRWQIAEGNNVEFWPVPNQNGNTTTLAGMIRFSGVKSLGAFTDDTHTADLDDQAIILFAAAKLAPAKEKADFVAQGQQRMRDIRANAVVRRRIKLFSGQSEGKQLRGPPRVYYRTT